ncbi:hypothetical protein K449DRAFT_435339 [Hypoxylon sp. EC38]|nr:hypothetical protein K449DRAFT_435339 [Hypoxylon sp. EC38]
MNKRLRPVEESVMKVRETIKHSRTKWDAFEEKVKVLHEHMDGNRLPPNPRTSARLAQKAKEREKTRTRKDLAAMGIAPNGSVEDEGSALLPSPLAMNLPQMSMRR